MKGTNEFKEFKEIPQHVGKSNSTINLRERVHLYDPRPKERVVASELIKWKPIDVVAARVVANAPWYCKVEEKPHFMHKETKADFANKPLAKPMIDDSGGRKQNLVDMDEAASRAALDISGRIAPRTVEAAETLVERAREATDAISTLLRSMGPGWDTLRETLKTETVAFRQARVGMELEIRQLMVDLKEVRDFFADEKYDKQMGRLKEFISLCQQLQELQKSGFLDAMVDTIIKL